MLFAQTVAVQRLNKCNTHKPHHHCEWQRTDDHRAAQRIHWISIAAVASYQQGSDYQRQDHAPNNAMLDGGLLSASGHNGVHHQNTRVRRSHQKRHNKDN
jgi:hypothetical protein